MRKLIDLTGKKFGKLTVIKRVGNDKYGNPKWLCKCDCGNEKIIVGISLKSGRTKSCGCNYSENAKKLLIDLTGQKFNKLTVIKRVENNKHNQVQWLCKCDCGNEIVVLGQYLKTGHTKSCGCYSKNLPTAHNLIDHRLYMIWQQMKLRCFNKNNPSFKYYGGRGITICDEWLNNPFSFFNWSMQNGYTNKLTIDRIDVNGNYCPSNCRWVDMKIQTNNTRRNYLITYNDETYTLAEWSDRLHIHQSTLFARLKRGWSTERAFTTPVQKHATPQKPY